MRILWGAAALMFACVAVASAQSGDPEPLRIEAPKAKAAAPARAAATGANISSLDYPGVIAALQGAGMTAEIKTENGARYVLARHENTPFQVFLSSCEGARCRDLEIYAGFSGTQKIAIERINAWNARVRFVRAFLDEDGDPALQMDVGLDGGVTPANLRATLETWGSALDTYSLFLLSRVAPTGAVTAPAAPAKK
jgi:hypothetical protein